MSEPQGTRAFSPFEWMLSLRYLRARRKEGFISVIAGFSFLGIMLGVATLIIVMAVMNGFRKELLDKILGLNGHLLIQPLEKPLTDWEEVAARVAGAQGIRLAAPIVEGQALASSPFNAGGVLVRGIRLMDLEKLPSIANNIKQGSLKGFDDEQGVVIGRRLADQLSLRSGDNITLVAPRGAVTPMGTTPRIKVYKIAAVFEIGMSEYDNAMVFMPLKEAQAYFNRAGDVTAIEVYTDNPDRVDRYRSAVQDSAQRPIFIIDWRQRNATFFNALQVERNVMFLILTLIVLVAALNIVSGLIMLVKDKGQDIAILRTMGANSGRDHARLSDHRRIHWCCRHDRRLHPGRRRLPQYRKHPAVLVVANEYRTLFTRALFPFAPARRHGFRRDDGSRHNGTRAFAARDIVPVMAGGTPRSGGGVAL